MDAMRDDATRDDALGTHSRHGGADEADEADEAGDADESVLREYVINRHGTDYVLYAGLLAEAHRRGLRRLLTRLVQIPAPHNGFVAVCHAEIAIEGGTFEGMGEATPMTTARTGMGGGTLVGVAETRAKARALCDALGVNMVPIEDLPEVSR
jgi:hypothetical protein